MRPPPRDAGDEASLETPSLERRRYSSFLRLIESDEHRVVLSLGGGAAPGLAGNTALCAVLEALGADAEIEEVWGTSAGAAVGGPWATGTPAEAILRQIVALDRRGVVDVAWWRLAIGFLLRPFGRSFPGGLIHGRHFAATIRNTLSAARFEDSQIPFRCIACSDDGLGRTKVFRRGPLEPAIFASMALPGIIIPREEDEGQGTGYYDGGLVEKTPLRSPISEHLRSGDGRKLLIIATRFGSDARRVKAEGFVGRFVHTIHALSELTWTLQITEARARDDVELIVLNPHIVDPKLFDFSRVPANYAHAYRAFSDQLQNARLALTFGHE